MILGNSHRMEDDSNKERSRVIELYRQDLDKDFLNKGMKYNAIVEIVNRIMNGEKLAGACWCKPKACHGDLILEKINLILEKLGVKKTFIN